MAAPRYRIGNDLTVFWAIHNRDGSPFDFKGKEVRLYVTNERGRQEVKASLSKLEDGTANNVIRWDFKGRDQKVLGLHSLSVEIQDKGDTREITKDYSEAFIFVSRSEMEDEEGDANISVRGDLILSSNLDIYRFEAIDVDVADLKEGMKGIEDAIDGINEEAINIKVSINGIQKEVEYLGKEMTTKASVDTVVEIGKSITEVQHNVAEQTIKVNSLGAEIATKASADSVTQIGNSLTITNNALAEQNLRVTDLEAEITDKASLDSVTQLGESLKIANESLAKQELLVNTLSAEINTKASVKTVADLGDEVSSVRGAVAEQNIRVEGLTSEIRTKASNEHVSRLGDEINLIEEAAAEQVIRVDGLEALIETKVSRDVFDAKTGEIENAYTTLKQTTEGIEATVKSNSGEITSIKQNIN